MTPAIERVNLDEYTVKLDAVLTEIINSTNLIDNKEILGNFKSLMTEPDKDTISLKEVFEKYKEYVSENVDTSELEVYTDDEAKGYARGMACAIEIVKRGGRDGK